MAKRNASNQDYTNNADGWDLTGGTTGRKLTVTGADITLTGSGSNVYTFPASTSTLASLGLAETFSAAKTFSVLPILSLGATFTGVASPTYSQGKLVYDTDNESLTFYNNDSNVSLQIGQEFWIRVRNVSGSTITNGKAVYITGSNSGLPTVGLAKADAVATAYCVGLATEDIANNTNGYVTTAGMVRGIDTSGFAAGATLYLSDATAGNVTSTAPTTTTSFRQRLGFVGVSNATTGTIFMQPNDPVMVNLNPVSNDGAALGTTALQWSDLFLASGGVINFNNGDATLTHSSDAITVGGAEWVLAAGTTSIAPLKFQSGTNLTTSEAGGFEYDGTIFMSSPLNSARGVSPSIMYSIVASGDFNLATTSGVQAAFASTGDVWTLAGSTSYFFEGVYQMTRTTSTVTTAMAFALGGGASVTSILYSALTWLATVDGSQTTQTITMVDTVSSTVVAATTSATTSIVFRGIIRMNQGGTVTPQVSWSANTTAPVMKANSYIRFFPIGGNTQNILGNVA